MDQEDHIMREKRSARIVDSKIPGTQNESNFFITHFANNIKLFIPDQGKYVEFFNPKIRRELEKKDEEFKKAFGYKGAAPGGDEWVWLTSYCRIPVTIVFQSAVYFCYFEIQYFF